MAKATVKTTTKTVMQPVEVTAKEVTLTLSELESVALVLILGRIGPAQMNALAARTRIAAPIMNDPDLAYRIYDAVYGATPISGNGSTLSVNG